MAKNMKVKETPKKCPVCGGRIVRILYGYPTAESMQLFKQGQFALGGCCIEVDENGNSCMPEWQCVECGHEF